MRKKTARAKQCRELDIYWGSVTAIILDKVFLSLSSSKWPLPTLVSYLIYVLPFVIIYLQVISPQRIASSGLSLLKLHVMKTCSPFLRISSGLSHISLFPKLWSLGFGEEGRGKGVWGSAFCLYKPPISHSVSLPVILLYDEVIIDTGLKSTLISSDKRGHKRANDNYY